MLEQVLPSRSLTGWEMADQRETCVFLLPEFSCTEENGIYRIIFKNKG